MKKPLIDPADLPARITELEDKLETVEWLLFRAVSILNLLPSTGYPFPSLGMDYSLETRGFVYADFPQLPAAERNLLIGHWHGQGRSSSEIAVLLSSRGHVTKKGAAIKTKVIERIIQQIGESHAAQKE